MLGEACRIAKGYAACQAPKRPFWRRLPRWCWLAGAAAAAVAALLAGGGWWTLGRRAERLARQAYIEQLTPGVRGAVLTLSSGENVALEAGGQRMLVEQAVETVIEAVAQNREAMIYEASDLVYHLLVLLEATGCSIADLEKELARRHS